jgi:hypothetical protein
LLYGTAVIKLTIMIVDGYVLAALVGAGWGDATATGVAVAGEVPAIALAFLATKELSIIAKPVIWLDCKRETLISRLSIVPFDVDPLRMAGGCGCPSGGSEFAGTGTMPSWCSPGSEETGS